MPPRRLPNAKKNMLTPKSILIFHPAGIGDAILAVPAIKVVREALPKAYIVLVTSKRAHPLVELCPYVDGIFAIEMDAISHPLTLLNGEKLINVCRLISSLRSHRFDIIADFTRIGPGFSIIKRILLFRLIGGKYIFGRDTLSRGFYLDGKIYDPVPPVKHAVDSYLELANLLGANETHPEMELFLTEKDNEVVDSLLSEVGIQSEKLIVGINPGGFRPSRRWLKGRFAAVADKLICDYKAQIVFIGSKGEATLIEEICSIMRFEPVNLAGKTGLRQLAALIKRFDLLITNDSGPMHIAAAVKTPIIALFGPQTPTLFQPYCEDNMRVIIRKDVECSPCDDKVNCKDHRCMKLITVEDVLAGVDKMYREVLCKA